MKNTQLQFILVSLFILLTIVYYFVSFGNEETDKVFITIATFFFSIFSGFFITRQGARYTKLREIIGSFDGKLSSVYRAAGNVSVDVQNKIGIVISEHYEKILTSKKWDYHFTNKSSTITAIHSILETNIGDVKQESLRNQAIGRIMTGLSDCQVLRKNMVMLYQERIPSFQWFLIFFFMLILLAAVTVIPSQWFILGAILKSAFAVSIISIVLILQNLDNLHLFEGVIGEASAQDVIGIINGSK